MKQKHPNYVPRISWECENIENRSYWIISAFAHIPGDESLSVDAVFHMPHRYAYHEGGLRPYLLKDIEELTTSISYKYNMLVRKHAHKNKHAAAALAAIEDFHDKRDAV